jgi:hypothetical protein
MLFIFAVIIVVEAVERFFNLVFFHHSHNNNCSQRLSDLWVKYTKVCKGFHTS